MPQITTRFVRPPFSRSEPFLRVSKQSVSMGYVSPRRDPLQPEEKSPDNRTKRQERIAALSRVVNALHKDTLTRLAK